MKKLFLLLYVLCINAQSKAQVYAASNFTLIGKIDPETGVNADGDKYSGCWGWYQSSKKKEYAIACAQAGTYWVDVTNPATPTVSAYRGSTHTGATWREAKTYLNFCYVISDDPGNNSFQIFDMQYLPDSVHKVYDGKSYFSRGHTLWVDGDKLYVASVTYSNNSYSSMNVYSLATPTAPLLIRSLSQDYSFVNRVHDMFVRRDTIFASCEYQGLNVFKLTSANTFTQLGSLTGYTASGYNHSSALTPDGKTLVFMDEVPNGLPIKVTNVVNLSNIQVLATINQYSATTPHNPFIVNNQYCFVSAYEEGLQLFDISNPSAPTLAGYFDTYPQGGGNTGNWSNPYGGQWGSYPFFPSKNIFALDQSNGVFMLKTSLYQNTVSTTSLAENNFSSIINFFPNPTSKAFQFNVPVELSNNVLDVAIYSVDGKLMYQKKIYAKESGNKIYREVELEKIEDGIYFVNIFSEGERITSKKLVISANYGK